MAKINIRDDETQALKKAIPLDIKDGDKLLAIIFISGE